MYRGYFPFPSKNINSILLEKQGEALTGRVRAAPVPFTRTQKAPEELSLSGSPVQTPQPLSSGEHCSNNSKLKRRTTHAPELQALKGFKAEKPFKTRTSAHPCEGGGAAGSPRGRRAGRRGPRAAPEGGRPPSLPRARPPPAEPAMAAARGRVLCLFDVDGTLTPARQVARRGGAGLGGARPARRSASRRLRPHRCFPARKSSRRWTRSCGSCGRGCTSAWWEAPTMPR